MITEKVKKAISKHRIVKILSFPILPIGIFILMLHQTSTSLFRIAKGLLFYNWTYLSANDRKNGYNNLFYYLQDLAVQKSGRYGITHYFNGGNFSLARLFHLTPVSLRFQASFGTVFMMFFAMMFWVISWFVLYGFTWNIFMIIFFTLFSTLFYACFIEIQNYNILGWMLYPILLTSLVEPSFAISTGVVFLISVLSFTAFIVSIPFVIVVALFTEPLMILTLIPGLIKIMIPIIKSGQLKKTFNAVNGKGKVKYIRDRSKDIRKYYLYVMMGQFVVLSLWMNGLDIYTIFILGTFILFIINMSFIRFADEQSFYICYLSVGVFSLVNQETQNLTLMISYFFSIYLIYALMLNVRTNKILTPGVRVPFSCEKDIQGLRTFLSPIKKDNKVIMAYKNPEGEYNKIFSGYRIFNEPIQYAAALNQLRYMPDWYTIFENNNENSPEDFWIDTPDKAQAYMIKHNIKYVIVPEFIDGFGEDVRFEVIGSYFFDVPKNPYKLILFNLK